MTGADTDMSRTDRFEQAGDQQCAQLAEAPIKERKDSRTRYEKYAERLDLSTVREGWVVRDAGPIRMEHFTTQVGKWVRANHVQTDDHWMHHAVVPNKVKP